MGTLELLSLSVWFIKTTYYIHIRPHTYIYMYIDTYVRYRYNLCLAGRWWLENDDNLYTGERWSDDHNDDDDGDIDSRRKQNYLRLSLFVRTTTKPEQPYIRFDYIIVFNKK